MNKLLFSTVFLFFMFSVPATPQGENVLSIYYQWESLYSKGNFIKAESTLLKAFKNNNQLIPTEASIIYNNLGATYQYLGRYNDALDAYRNAEINELKKPPKESSIGIVYFNMGIIYQIQKSYPQSIQFFEKSIRIIGNSRDYAKLLTLASAYAGMGLTYFLIEDYPAALKNYTTSLGITQSNKLKGKSLILVKIARTYARMDSPEVADENFRKGIESAINEYGPNHYMLAEIYFGYGQFLREEGRVKESLDVLQKAFKICLAVYGDKNILTSLACKNLGDTYLKKNEFDSALYYYQKSIISVTKDFSNTDPCSNPGIDSSLFELRLLDNLKSKSIAFAEKSAAIPDNERKKASLECSLSTMEPALLLIDKIRGTSLTEENKMYLAEIEKPTYFSAIKIASELYKLTGDRSLLSRIYNIAQKSKSSVLRNEIAANQLLYSSILPDSVRKRYIELSSDIAAYNKFIMDESVKSAESDKSKPDSLKIALWNDELFVMNRQMEAMNNHIADIIPDYHEMVSRTEPVFADSLRKKLNNNTTILDYYLSTDEQGGPGKIYIFLITKDKVILKDVKPDPEFFRNINIIKNTSDPSSEDNKGRNRAEEYATALHCMYVNLIQPVEKHIKGNSIIVIPDAELEWLPFEAFLKEPPDEGINDFEGLHFLLYDYSVSYGYCSSLLHGPEKNCRKHFNFIAFSPDYKNDLHEGFDPLSGTRSEINSINKLFVGETYSDGDATKTNFVESLQKPAILHLAMHLMPDSMNSSFSYLLFNTDGDDGKLYNYEICTTRMRSPMVVLSACNSGSGTLHSGSELMSIARSFILSGASSVVKTIWAVNDETSSQIITEFYYYLSKGFKKDEALRLAKLNFIRKSPPSCSNPFFWAAYEVLGDTCPVEKNIKKIVTIVTISLAGLLAVVLLVYYFRRRRIFMERD